MAEWLTWRTAMERALYGTDGFYRRGEAPDAHFRTSVHASGRFATAFARLLAEVDAGLGHPPRLDLVDIGAGCGGLLTGIMNAAEPGLAARLAPLAVEVRPRPPGFPATVEWRSSLPDTITGLVIANEWLDNVPLDVVELAPGGPRLVQVDPATGAERLGPPPAAEDLAWLERWWPLREIGDRAEVGHPRCTAWGEVARRLDRGLAVAVDYCHTKESRPAFGSLTAYRDGHVVPLVADGSCDITAHVALDACAAQAEPAALRSQRDSLRALGLSGTRPDLELARRDPRGYLAALAAAGAEAELIDPAGLGGFTWLSHAKGMPSPLR